MEAKNETTYQFKQNLLRKAIPAQNQFIQAFAIAAVNARNKLVLSRIWGSQFDFAQTSAL